MIRMITDNDQVIPSENTQKSREAKIHSPGP